MRKKRSTRQKQRFYKWLNRQEEGGIFHRIAWSSAAGITLQEERPVWFWICFLVLLAVFVLPVCLYSLSLELLGHSKIVLWETLPYIIGFFSALFAGLGTANLFMIPLERLCARLLRKDFPRGFDVPFYLGHKVTLFFLSGCGGLSVLCLAFIHLF